MGTSETLRSVIDAGRTSRRLDELSAARVIGKAAQRVHASQQKAGAGKSIGPVTPAAIGLASTGEVSLTLPAASALAYSAPEVVSGGSADRRSDVFSLGVSMWEALTHQRLFEAMNDAAVKAAVGEREIKPPSELNANIPAELSAICMRALARNPADRYQSAKSMAVEIEEFLEGAGYADSDEQIAAYLAELGKPKTEKKVTLPPPTRPAESPTPTPPPGTLPSVLTAPTQPPSVLRSSNTQPPPISSSGVALASALASAGASAAVPSAGTVTAPSDKPSTAPGLGPSVLVAPAPAATTRTANGTEPPVAVPLPPVLPPSTIVAGNGAHAAATKAEPAKAEPATAEAAQPAKPEAKPAQPPPVPVAPVPPVLPAPATAKAVDDAAPAAPMGPGESRPNPAAVVALPHRDSKDKDLLAGWGWGTDAHPAITDDSDLELPNHGSNRKLMLYLLGGGLVFTIMVAVIAFGFGGSKKKKVPPPVATTQEWNGSAKGGSADTAPAGSADTALTGSADTAPAGSADNALAGSADSALAGSAAVATTGSAAAGSADTMAAGSADTMAAGSAVAAGSAAVATTGPVNPYPDAPKVAKVETPKVETPKVAKVETPKTAKVETPKVAKVETPKVAKVETPKTTKTTKVETPKTAKTTKTETPKTTKTDKPEQKVDVETAYRIGLQQFARGDMTGALASLRTSLAGNPNYAPTWRGLGLVFEKLGEKDQARAAFKRYLQLAPNAGDAEQIHARMERLGS